MDPDRDSFWACVAGALVYGVLYLGLVVLLALHWNAPWGVSVAAVASAGAAYLSFFVQMGFSRFRLAAIGLVLLSILLGMAALVYLLVFILVFQQLSP